MHVPHVAKVQHVPMQGMTVAGKRNLGLLQRQDLAAAAPVKRVLEALELFELMETLMQVSKHPVTAPVWPLAPAQGQKHQVKSRRNIMRKCCHNQHRAYVCAHDAGC